MMMTSWAIVADVWYLPPMTKEPGEDAIAFASRVKATIAKKVSRAWCKRLQQVWDKHNNCVSMKVSGCDA